MKISVGRGDGWGHKTCRIVKLFLDGHRSHGFRATDAQRHNEDICAILIEGLDVVTALSCLLSCKQMSKFNF